MIRSLLPIILLIGIGCGATLGFLKLIKIGGPGFDPANESNKTELRKIIYSFLPLVETLHEMKERSGSVPDKLESVPGIPRHFLNTYQLLHLSNHGNSFSLYYKLGWDPSIGYDSTNRQWFYDPGNGRKRTPIEP